MRLWPVYLLLTLICLVGADVGRELISAPFPPGLLGMVPILLCALFGPLTERRSQNKTIPAVIAFSTLLAGATLFAITAIPGTSSAHFIGIALALGVTSGLGIFRLSKENHDEATPTTNSQRSTTQQQELKRSTEFITLLAEELESLNDDDLEVVEQQGEVLQSWSRIRLPSGTERLEGSLTVQFQAGEKIQHCHLPISPPLKNFPSGWCECSENGVRAEFSLLQTYGARLSLRRSSTQLDEQATEIAFVLESSHDSRKAA